MGKFSLPDIRRPHWTEPLCQILQGSTQSSVGYALDAVQFHLLRKILLQLYPIRVEVPV